MSALEWDIEELERDTLVERSKAYEKAERQCRIALAANWPRAVPLEWNPGGFRGQKSTIMLHPGKFVIQPLSKAQAWFGPFSLYYEIRTADESQKPKLRELWRAEKKRYLERYGWPRRSERGYTPDLAKAGPNRSPDVTITILEPDGRELPELRLYKIYKIGEFDEDPDTFATVESVEAVKARHDADMAALNERYEREANENAKKIAELTGLVQGFIGAQSQEKRKGG